MESHDATRAEADKGKKASTQAADLEKQNKDLSARLATAEKKASTPTADPAELKRLRADADSAHADADKARKSAADLEKKNTDLNAQLASAKKEELTEAQIQQAVQRALSGRE